MPNHVLGKTPKILSSCQQELSFNHILHAYVLSKQQSIHNIIHLHNVFNTFYTIRGLYQEQLFLTGNKNQ